MGRTKIKHGKAKIYYLEEETIEEIRRYAGLNQMSDSSYLDFLIKNDKLSKNPMLRVKKIQNQKSVLQEKMKELDLLEKQEVEEASNLHEWQEKKRLKKGQAIDILKRKIREEDYEQAEEIAKTWERITGIPAIALLIEAKKVATKEGV